MHHGKASPHVCMHAVPCRQAVEAQMHSDFLVGGGRWGMREHQELSRQLWPA